MDIRDVYLRSSKQSKYSALRLSMHHRSAFSLQRIHLKLRYLGSSPILEAVEQLGMSARQRNKASVDEQLLHVGPRIE